MESCCKAMGAPGRLIPVPGEITAGCGLAWSARPEEREILEQILKECELEAEGIYEILF